MPPNEYSEFVVDDTANQLKSSLYSTSGTEPDTEAKLQALAKKTGVPVDAVRQNQKAVELNDRLDNFDYDKVIKESPKLSTWLADPQNASISHDDVGALSTMETILVRPFDYLRSIGKGFIGTGAGGTLSGYGVQGDILNRNKSKIGEAVSQTFDDVGSMLTLNNKPKMRGLLNLPNTDLSNQYLNSTNSSMASVKPRTDVLEGMSDSAALTSAGTALKSAGDYIGVPKSRQAFDTDVAEGIGQLGFQILSSLATGNFSNMSMMSAQGADQMAQQVKNDKGSQAQIDEAVLLGSVITPLTEKFGLDALLNRVPPAIKNRTLRFIADKFAAGGIEAAQEVTEGILQNVAQRATTNPNADLTQGLADQASVAGVSAALVRTMLGVKRFGVEKEHQAFFESLQQGTTDSKTFQRLPDRFQELVKTYTQDGPLKNVFVDAAKVNEYYQSQNIDPATAMSDAGATNYHEALQTGGDVVIPMDGFVAKIAPTDALQSLMPDLRLAQGDASLSELRLEEANADNNQEAIQKNIEAITQAAETDANLSTAVTDIINNVSGQLQARYDTQTANKLATVMRGIAVLANRNNPDANPVSAARELWAKYGLTVNANPLPQVLSNKPDFDVQIDSLIDRVRTGDVPNQSQINGQSLLDFLKEKGGIQDEGGELTARDVQSTNKAFTKNLFNPQGLSLDTARELAAEAGYVAGDGTVADFLDSLDNEIRGEPVYSQNNFNNESYQQAQALNELGDWLDKMGINLAKSDNKTVKALMKTAMGGAGTQHDQSYNPSLARGEMLPATKEELDIRDEVVKSQLIESQEFNKAVEASMLEVENNLPKSAINMLKEIPDAKNRLLRSRVFSEMGEGDRFDRNVAPEWSDYREARSNTARLEKQATDMFYNRIGAPEYEGMLQDRTQTQTPEFKKWFGNSKVVDENGKPLIDFHGTRADILMFNTLQNETKVGKNVNWTGQLGSWFAAPSDWNDYEIGNAESTAEVFSGDEGSVYPVYLSIKNPMEYEGYEDLQDDIGNKNPIKLKEKLKNEGYDGIVVRGSDTDGGQLRDDWVAFEPTQIKSAIGNNGNFDANNPNILYQSEQDDLLTMFNDADSIEIPAIKQTKEQVNADEAKFLSTFPEGTRYNRDTKLLKRIRSTSDKAFDELNGSPETTREVNRPLGHFSAYRITAETLEPDSFNPNGSLQISVYGKEQLEKGLTQEPALLFTVKPDGELTVNGPTPSGETFAEFQKLGWAEKAKGADNVPQDGWSALTHPSGGKIPISEIIPLLADVHARFREYKMDDYVGLYWGRATGALGGSFIDNPTAIYFQSEAQTDAPEFKEWSHGNQLIELDSGHLFRADEPVVVEALHGTTADFTVFDKERSNPESDFGAGFYFTNERGDVGENYAGRGPDLTNKVQQLAERIASDTDREYDDPDVIKEAEAEFIAHEGMVIPAYVRFDNPLVVGGRYETQFTYEEKYDEENDEYSEPEGTLVDLIDALRSVSSDYSDGDVEGLIDSLLQEAVDGSVYASDVERIMKESEEFNYFTDDNGTLASHELKRAAFEYMGFDGVIDQTVDKKFGSQRRTGKSMEGMNPDTVHFIAFEPTQIKSAIGNSGKFDPNNPDILFQKSNEDKRGSIEIGNDRKIIINLFEKQNLSTFLHEAGHFYLEVLGDLANDENSSQQIKDDYAKVLKFLGVNNRSEIGTDQHELFARANEAYLMEGKAPSNELRGVFQRFKAWMQFIYKTAKALNVNINDDIRGVFDRIYATDAEIEDAKRQDGFKELFIDAKSAGMTDSEFNAYKDTVANQTENAKDKLRNQTMKIERLKRESWFKEERAKVADEVAAEYDAEPAAQAFDTLTSKDGGLKLNRSDLEKRYGDLITRRLRRGYGEGKGAVYADDGVDLDSAAEVLGYPSADELVNALANLPERKRFIAAESNQRMMERHGDIINDIGIADAAQEALHNGQREQVLKTELRAMRKLIEPTRKILREANQEDLRNARAATSQPSPSDFRDVAREIIGQKAVQDINPNTYLLNERKASRQAFEAMAKKDYQTASAMKQRELLNHYLFIEATKAKAESVKIYEYAKSFEKDAKRQKLGKAGGEYLEQIDALLERYEFKKVSNKDIARRHSLAAWVAEQTSQGNAVSIDTELLNESITVNYREIPMDELRSVNDALKNIDHLANLKTKLIRKGKQLEFEDVKNELLNAVASSNLKSTGELDKLNSKSDGIKQKGAQLWRDMDASHLKIEQIVEWLDNGKINGPWARLFFDLADDAQTKEYDLHREITKKIQVISESMPKDWQSSMLDKTGVTLPNTGNLTRYDLISIALNTGNEQNLQRLLDGRGWNKDQLDRALAKLTKEDWQFVQGMWDTLETLWPEIAELEKRQSGLEPEKVEHREFEPIEGLTLRGGYFPLVYDPKLSAVGEKQADETASVTDFMSRGYGRPSTDRGATKKRVKQFSAPVLLDYEQVLTSHMAKVVKDISHREAVLGLNKILTNGQIKSALIDKLGDSRYREMRNWLQVLISDRADTLHQASGLGKFMRHARTNTAIVTMGFKISTAFAQFAGFAASMDLVKPHILAQSMIEFSLHPVKTVNFVFEKSGEMRNRSNTIDRDIKESLQALRGNSSKVATIQRTAFYLTAMADKLVSIPTWLGAYKQGQLDGLSEEDSIRQGDRAVRLSQGSGGAKDLAAVQRNNELMRLLTMYYTPFSVLYSRLRDVGHNVNSVKDLPKAVARTIALVMLPAVMGEILAGRPPDDDEDGIWWAIRKMLLYPLNTIPVLRDLSGYLESGIIKASGEGEMKYPPSYKLSPIVGSIEKILKVPSKVDAVFEGSKEVNDVAWDVFETSGLMFGLPTAQPRITGEYMMDVLSGDEEPQDASEFVAGALFRRSK